MATSFEHWFDPRINILDRKTYYEILPKVKEMSKKLNGSKLFCFLLIFNN
jgi:hypothetical protein